MSVNATHSTWVTGDTRKQRLLSLSWLLLPPSNTSSSPTQESHEADPPWVWKCAGWDGRPLPLWGFMIRVQGNGPGTTAGNSSRAGGRDQAELAQSRVHRCARLPALRLQVTGRGAPECTGAFQRSPPKGRSCRSLVKTVRVMVQSKIVGVNLPPGLTLADGSALH